MGRVAGSGWGLCRLMGTQGSPAANPKERKAHGNAGHSPQMAVGGCQHPLRRDQDSSTHVSAAVLDGRHKRLGVRRHFSSSDNLHAGTCRTKPKSSHKIALHDFCLDTHHVLVKGRKKKGPMSSYFHFITQLKRERNGCGNHFHL